MDHETHPRFADSFHPTASPAVLPAAGVLAGTCAASGLAHLSLAAAGLGLALGLVLRGRAGLTLAALALGLLSAGLRPRAEPGVGAERPVELLAVVTSHPIREGEETFFHGRVRRWRQGLEVRVAAFDLRVTVPGDVPEVTIGTTVRVRGYLRRSAGFANVPEVAPGPWRIYLKSERFLSVEQRPGALSRLATVLRRAAESVLDSAGQRPGTALVRALLLGDRSRLPKAQQQALRRSGLAHLLAVSGLHVGLLATILWLAGGALPGRSRYLPPLVGVTLYLLLVGPRPAVLRAAFMGVLALLALTLERPPRAFNALACCVSLMVLHDPTIVGELGFQLSVAATAGILVVAPVFASRWRALPAWARAPLAATVSAQILTLPWAVPLTAGIHPLAPLFNLVAIPYLTGYLLAAFGWLATAIWWPAAAHRIALGLDAAAQPVEWLAAGPRGPAVFLPLELPVSALLGVAAAAIAVGCWPRRAARAGAVAGVLLLAGGGGSAGRDPRVDGLEMVLFDVGQGDAILLRDGSEAVLIDGGGWRHGDFGGRVLIPALTALGVRRLSAVVLTHPDLDHCGGLVDVARYLPVEEVWMGPGWLAEPCAAELAGLAGLRWRPMWRGEVAAVGRWHIEALSPVAGSRRGLNDRSLVLLASTPELRLLLTGDVSAAIERRLAAEAELDGGVDVLKVAHHGSKSSTSRALLEALHPRLALISAGVHNAYGHPHPTVRNRLREAGCPVLRTDLSGMIRLHVDAEGQLLIETPGLPRRISGK